MPYPLNPNMHTDQACEARVVNVIHQSPASSIRPWNIIAAFLLAAQFAAAQEYAPASLAIGSTASYVSIGNSTDGPFTNRVSGLTCTSSKAFVGITDGTTGTYTYTRTSGTKATLTYTSFYSEPGYNVTENATVLLTFTGYGVATFTSSGTYSGSFDGGPFNGTFTSTGTFDYDGPTISNVTDKATNEDTATSAIPFTIGDGQTIANDLTVTGASSNATLVPPANIVFGSSGNNRTVTVTPAANQTGTATITLTVSNDGTLTAKDTFVLTVNAVNDAPTISDVVDRFTTLGTSTGAIPFTVGDVETVASSLTVTRASSNTTLVPLANVVLGGSGANRTVTITPAAGQSGTSTITLTVSDGTLTATDTFVLTVGTPNNAPTISDVTDKSTNQNTSTGPIPFTVGDLETASGSLMVTRSSSNTTLVPLANVVLGGSGASRTVTITPAANQSGTTTITLTVSDGTLTATDTFVLTVSATQSITNWRQTYFLSPDNSGDGADLNDFDRDGLRNLLEYALGSNPKDPASAYPPVVSEETVSDQPYLTLTIEKPPGAIGISYVVEVSDNLDNWDSGPAYTTVIADNSSTLKVRDNTPAVGGSRYIRLKVTNP